MQAALDMSSMQWPSEPQPGKSEESSRQFPRTRKGAQPKTYTSSVNFFDHATGQSTCWVAEQGYTIANPKAVPQAKGSLGFWSMRG